LIKLTRVSLNHVSHT